MDVCEGHLVVKVEISPALATNPGCMFGLAGFDCQFTLESDPKSDHITR